MSAALAHSDLWVPGPPAQEHGGEVGFSLPVDVYKRIHSPIPGSLCPEMPDIKKVKREEVAWEEGGDKKGISQRVNMRILASLFDRTKYCQGLLSEGKCSGSGKIHKKTQETH